MFSVTDWQTLGQLMALLQFGDDVSIYVLLSYICCRHLCNPWYLIVLSASQGGHQVAPRLDLFFSFNRRITGPLFPLMVNGYLCKHISQQVWLDIRLKYSVIIWPLGGAQVQLNIHCFVVNESQRSLFLDQVHMCWSIQFK